MIDRLTGKVLKEFESVKAACNVTGLSNTLISKVCYGTQSDVHGHVFRFKDESHKSKNYKIITSLLDPF